jgi:nitric oxide reductase large subunit
MFDEASGVVLVSNDRARAMARVAQHYDDLFGGAPALAQLRDDYAMHDVVVPDAGRRKALKRFFSGPAGRRHRRDPLTQLPTPTTGRTSR